MNLAAGILFIARDTGRALFLKKGDNADPPGEWGFPWGHADADETMLQTAVRETLEECGPDAPVDPERLQLWTRRQGSKIDGTCFLQYVDHEFEPSISDEHIGAGWYPINEPPEPLNEGCRICLAKFGLDELGIAKAIRDGELTSPQKYVNVWLFDIRITGTGQAFRNALNEHVWRPPEEYLNEEFLERCQGLPVIWVHPETDVLDTEEYGKRVIGAIMIPYIKDDEVWGIAKIHDEPAAIEMRDKETSTSPGVMGVGNNKAKLEDGSNVLIETKPRLLDHLAVLPGLGVWDTDGEMRGVARTDAQPDSPDARNTTNGEHTMSEAETKTAEGEEAGKRADSAETPDKLLSKLDAATETMGKMAEKLDAMEKERADRQAKKDAKKDAKKRYDSLKDRCDSGEASEEEKAEFAKMEGERSDKKAKKDGDEKAAEAAHEAEGKAHEAEGEAMKDSQTRIDAQLGEFKKIIELQAKTIAELTTRTAPIPDDVLDKMADLQARCDSVAQLHGQSAPRPMSGETPLAYRKRLIKPFVKFSPTWKEAGVETLVALPEVAFNVAEQQIYADAAVAARDPAGVPAGHLRPMTVQQGGHTIITYHGEPGAWMNSFSGPTRQRVTGSFKANGSAH